MTRLIRKIELARLAGVSSATVTTATHQSNPMGKAVVGRLVDVEHPAVVEWLAKRGVSPTDAAKAQEYSDDSPTAEQDNPAVSLPVDSLPEIPELAEGSGELNREELERYRQILVPIVQRFGTAPAFREYLDALKKIVDIREKDLKNEEMRGGYISREYAKTHIIGLIETIAKRLLTESVRSIARRVHAEAKGGKTVQESEATVHEIISATIKHGKAKTIERLSDGE